MYDEVLFGGFEVGLGDCIVVVCFVDGWCIGGVVD